ncbi:MAG TPA: hypothetical protein VFI90_16425 [Rubrobacter sp.]|nr:hypothetical protein [Rubrobacter sp.]
MNKRDKQQLLKQVASIAEKAYRRGFQHGHLAASGQMGTTAPSEREVTHWRFAKHSKTHSVCPPGTVYVGKRDKLLDRLEWELEDQDMIRELLTEPKPSV